MLTITVLKGIPASGKSTWSKAKVLEDPNTIRINNDDLRSALHGGIYSPENEKLIVSTRTFLIRKALDSNKNVIIDNLNLNKRHFDDACSIARSVNKDITVTEKVFYIELEEAIERDSKREGLSKVGEKVIKEWWKKSGGKQLKHYLPKIEVFSSSQPKGSNQPVKKLNQDVNKPKAAIFDNDGTISLVTNRSPYDASKCDLDAPHEHVIECMKLYYNAGYKIIFVSGREEKDREPTMRFYKKHFPEVEYELYMRSTGDTRKDVIIKEEIYNNHLKDNYYISAWFDDRLQIVKWLYENNFPLFRVGNPEASF